MKKLLFVFIIFILCSGKQYVDFSPKAVLLTTSKGSKIVLSENNNLKIYSSKDIYDIDSSNFRLFKKVIKKENFKKGEYTYKINYQDLYLIDKTAENDKKEICIYKSPFDEAKKSVGELLKDINCPIKDLDDIQVVSLKVINDKFISLTIEGGGYSGGAHPIAYLNYFTYDINKKKYISFNELYKTNPDIPKKILEKIQVLASTGENEIIYDANQKQIEDQIRNILLSSGYNYDPDHFYPDVKDGQTGITFCFPHAIEVNRGTNYKVFIPLKKTPEIFKDYYNNLLSYPKLVKGKILENGNWSLSLDKTLNLNIRNLNINKSKILEKLADENDIIGIYWIHEWPLSEEMILENFSLI